jgi:hypothetical protein
MVVKLTSLDRSVIHLTPRSAGCLLLIVIMIVQQFVTAVPDLLALDVTRLIMLVLSLSICRWPGTWS